MKLLAKILITILLCGIAWLAELACIATMNFPNTAMVILGLAGMAVSIFGWCAGMNWLWSIGPRVRALYERLKKEIA